MHIINGILRVYTFSYSPLLPEQITVQMNSHILLFILAYIDVLRIYEVVFIGVCRRDFIADWIAVCFLQLSLLG